MVARDLIRARLFNTLAILALIAVFTPFVAPLADHHSAERMPYHGHLHPVSVPHDHGSAVGHSHDDETSALPSATFMPDRDGQTVQVASDGGADLIALGAYVRPAHAAGALPPDEQRNHSDPVKRPPEVPPRA